MGEAFKGFSTRSNDGSSSGPCAEGDSGVRESGIEQLSGAKTTRIRAAGGCRFGGWDLSGCFLKPVLSMAVTGQLTACRRIVRCRNVNIMFLHADDGVSYCRDACRDRGTVPLFGQMFLIDGGLLNHCKESSTQ